MKKKPPKPLYTYKNYSNLFFPYHLTSDRAKELNFRPVYLDDFILHYKYRFPILFWEKKDGTKVPTLFGEISVNTFNDSVRVDVVKFPGVTYAYFYCTEITQQNKDSHKMLITIHSKVKDELNKLGIIDKKRERTQALRKQQKQDKVSKERGNNSNDDSSRVQKTRKPKMGNSSLDKQISGRRQSNKDTPK